MQSSCWFWLLFWFPVFLHMQTQSTISALQWLCFFHCFVLWNFFLQSHLSSAVCTTLEKADFIFSFFSFHFLDLFGIWRLWLVQVQKFHTKNKTWFVQVFYFVVKHKTCWIYCIWNTKSVSQKLRRKYVRQK